MNLTIGGCAWGPQKTHTIYCHPSPNGGSHDAKARQSFLEDGHSRGKGKARGSSCPGRLGFWSSLWGPFIQPVEENHLHLVSNTGINNELVVLVLIVLVLD